MGYWNPQNGFVHLFFANQQDRYFLPSLLRLELKAYLYYLLRQRGFRSIIFLNDAEGKFLLQVFDGDSQKSCQQSEKKRFWDLFSQQPDNFSQFPCKTPEACACQLISLLEKEQRLALVSRLDTFSRLFRSVNATYLNRFSQAGHRYLEQNGNILLLQMPMNASGSQVCLTDPSGIFSGKLPQPLCREISGLQQKPHSVDLYGSLAKNLGERCVFLSRFSRGNLLLAVKYAWLTGLAFQDGNSPDFTDISDFLYSWYHSTRLRQKTGPLLSCNETRMFSDLLRELQDKRKVQAVCDWIRQMKEDSPGETLRQILLRQYAEDPVFCPVQADSQIAMKLKNFAASSRMAGAQESFQALAEAYQIPRTHTYSKMLEDKLLHCFSFLEKAAEEDDTGTFIRAENILRGYQESGFRFDQGDDETIWNSQKTILELSEQIFHLERQIAEHTSGIAFWEQERERLVQEVEQARPGLLLASPGEELALSSKMQQAVNASQQVENLKNLKAMKQSMRDSYQQTLRNLELTVSTWKPGTLTNLELVVQDAVQLLTEQTMEDWQIEKKLDDYSQNISYLLQGLPPEDPQQLIADYSKLLDSDMFRIPNE